MVKMPHFKQPHTPGPVAKRASVAIVVAFILAAFVFAYWINLPEWR